MKRVELSELCATPPARFVGAREELVKELREAGRGGEARQVAALRKPSAAVWAVNQLARTEPGCGR